MRESLHFAKKHFGNKSDLVGVEVGVEFGNNAFNILTEWEDLKKLFLVELNTSFESEIKSRLKDFIGHSRFELIFGDSFVVSQKFADCSLDFVYIDDDHEYDGIARSLNGWYPKVKYGGVVCGHDFCDVAVEDAVRGFFARNNMVLNVEGNDFWGIK